MIGAADVVVIGAGAFGASTAFHLARRGKRVVLADRFDFVSQTSPRAAGLTLQMRGPGVMTRLAMRSVAQIVALSAETGQPLEYHQSGSIKLARTQEYASQIHAEIAYGQAVGLPISPIAADEAHALAPFLHAEAALAMWYAPTDLYLEPRSLPEAYISAAGELGATLASGVEVTGIGVRNAAVEFVSTTAGTIETPVVVDSAGAWLQVIAEMTGAFVPVVPTRHQLYITRPIAGVADSQPIVRILDTNVYVRPERGGLMLGGYEPDPLQLDAREFPSAFSIQDLALDPEPLRRLAYDARHEFPTLQTAEMSELRGGLPTMTADGRFIVDQVPDARGFFVIGGCCVAGLSLSPAVGEAVAEWIVLGQPAIDLTELSLQRFDLDHSLSDPRRLREACLWRYAHSYSEETVPTA